MQQPIHLIPVLVGRQPVSRRCEGLVVGDIDRGELGAFHSVEEEGVEGGVEYPDVDRYFDGFGVGEGGGHERLGEGGGEGGGGEKAGRFG